jgi:hypothetical protein
MENFFEESPHPASSHLLPEGEDKEPTGDFSPKKSNFQMKSTAQKPSPSGERGNHRRWWVRGWFELKCEELADPYSADKVFNM